MKKRFYVVSIKKTYEDIEFQFESYNDMKDFLHTVLETSVESYEIRVKKVMLPLSKGDEE